MQRLVAELADTPHRYIVSTGPQHAEYELAENMVGEEFLPQTSVLPHVDAVITHGGNNTTTECMWFGKPMLVLPIFWDQHDNAQRVHETGFGIRLPTYDFEDGELAAALDRVLADDALRARCAAAGERLARASRDGGRRRPDRGRRYFLSESAAPAASSAIPSTRGQWSAIRSEPNRPQRSIAAPITSWPAMRIPTVAATPMRGPA